MIALIECGGQGWRLLWTAEVQEASFRAVAEAGLESMVLSWPSPREAV